MSFTLGKQLHTIASLTTPSPVPTLKSLSIVLIMYLASIPEECARSSAINDNFFSTVPLPSSSEIFCRLLKTFSAVKLEETKVFCDFFWHNCSATSPRSPNFFQRVSISFFDFPVTFCKTLITRFELMPRVLLSHNGKTLPCNNKMMFSAFLSFKPLRKSAKIAVFSSLLVVDSNVLYNSQSFLYSMCFLKYLCFYNLLC